MFVRNEAFQFAFNILEAHSCKARLDKALF